MSVAAPTPTTRMTTEEMLALPDNGTDRDLIRGELREKPMTVRNRWQGRSMVRLSYLLELWLERQPEPKGEVVSGEVGFRLLRNPDTSVGIDVALVSANVVTATPQTSPYFEGAPILAVEILSPSDKHVDVSEKIGLYKQAGVALIWIVDTDLQTVPVLRAGEEPELFNLRQDLSGNPELPGFRVPVADIFRF